MRPGSVRTRALIPWMVLVLLPVLVHAPELAGRVTTDPLYLVSGLSMFRHGPTAAVWIDPNAGFNTEAVGWLAARDWLSGHVPWWNPYTGIGMPLAGQAASSALFLPFVLLLALPNGVLALKIAVQIVAGLATFALLRQMRLSRLAALLGGILFELGGTFAWYSHAPIFPIAFLPMLLLGIERAAAAAQAHRRGGWAWIAAAIGWSLLAGFPEIGYIDGLLALCWAALRLVQSATVRGSLLGKLAAGGVAGLLLGAPQIVSFAGLLPLAGQGVHDLLAHIAIEPHVYALYLVPYLYGPLYGHGHGNWELVGGYVGLPSVLLGVLALLRRGPLAWQQHQALRWLLAAWLLVTLGKTAGAPVLADAVNLIPLLKQTMFVRLVQPTWQIACVVLAALAVDDWRRAGRAWTPAWIGLAVVTAMLGLAVIGGWPVLRTMAAHPRELASAGVWALASAALITALVAARATQRRAVLLAAVVAADAIVMFMAPLAAAGNHARLDRAPIRFLQAHLGLQRFYTLGPFAPNFAAMFGLASVNYNVILNPLDWVHYVQQALDPGANDVGLIGWYPPPWADRIAALRANRAAFAGLGVRYVLAPAALPQPLAQAPVLRSPTTQILELPEAAPYWEAAHCTLAPRGRLAVRARCTAPSVLIRRELFFPGWTARIDGAPAAIAEAPPLFQSVALKPGDSTVRFAYAPPYARLAWICCAAGAAILLGGLALSSRRFSPGSARRVGRARS